jgi:hypothetical protein
MQIAGQEINEILSIETLVLKPGETSEKIKRTGNEHLIVIATQGIATMKPLAVPESLGYLLNYSRIARLDFRAGDEFKIEVRSEEKEDFKVILLKVLLTKHC